jgi:hypothetical protein
VNPSDDRTFAIGDISVRLLTAPPVYAPGGQVAFVERMPAGANGDLLARMEFEAHQRGAVLMVVPCDSEHREHQALLAGRDYTFASSWYVGSTENKENTQNNSEQSLARGDVRAATVRDVPRLLEIGEQKRLLYERFSPIFWKVAPTPREEFAPYVTGQIQNERNVALVREREGQMVGYIIAQAPSSPGGDGYVDDYAVAGSEGDWQTVGAALLVEAGRQAASRGIKAFMVVTAHADTPKRAVLESLGFTLQKIWHVRPLGAML